MRRAPPGCAPPRLPTPYSYEISLHLGKKVLQPNQIDAPPRSDTLVQPAQFRHSAERSPRLRGQPLPHRTAVLAQVEPAPNGIKKILEQSRPRRRRRQG